MRVLVRLLLVSLTLAAAAQPAHAQFKSLRTGNDDIDMGSPQRAKPAAQDEAAADDNGPADGKGDGDTFIPGISDKQANRAGRDAGFDAAKGRKGAPDAGAAAPDAGLPGDAGAGGGSGDKAAAPLILPPSDGVEQLNAAWSARRQAAGRSAVREVAEQEKAVSRLRGELGCRNLFVIGAALASEAEALSASDGPEALRRAMLAAELAPDLPSAHWAVARTAFREDVTNVGRYFGSAVDALQATWREPRWRAALVADLAFALIGGFLLAAAGVVVLLFLRHARYFLHDFHHLFPRGAWQAQTAIAGLLVLALPLFFGLGPFAFMLTLALAAWLHLSTSEKAVVAVLFVLAGLSPMGAQVAERYTEFVGTRAETIYLVQTGGPDDAAALSRLQALGERADAPYEALYTLGRRARLLGQVPAAVAWLRQAAELRPSSIEALLELGSALYLSGDVEGARETWQRVLSVKETSVEAHSALARLFDRRAKVASREEASAQITEAQAHQRRLIELDPKLGAAFAQSGEPDLHANAWLPLTPVDVEGLTELAQSQSHPSWVGEDVARRLFWFFPRAWAFLAGPAAALLLGLATLVRNFFVPSNACGKCGRPVCRRCDAEVVGPAMCGQCLTIFAQRVAVDPPARAAKEAQDQAVPAPAGVGHPRRRSAAPRRRPGGHRPAGGGQPAPPGRRGRGLGRRLPPRHRSGALGHGAGGPGHRSLRAGGRPGVGAGPAPGPEADPAHQPHQGRAGPGDWGGDHAQDRPERDTAEVGRAVGASPMALSGTLKDFGIADIFQLIGQQQKTGVLHLTEKDDEVHVSFKDGNIVRAESATRKKKELLGDMLVRAGLVSERGLQEALDEQKRTLKRLGDILVAHGKVERSALREMAQLQTSETIYRLFAWKTGNYAFETAEIDFDPETVTPIRSESVLMEGFRRVDEWPLIRKRITSASMTFERVKDLPAPKTKAKKGDDVDEAFAAFDGGGAKDEGEDEDDSVDNVGPNERRIYRIADDGKDVSWIIDRSRLGEFEACKGLMNLVNGGYLKAVNATADAAAAAASGRRRRVAEVLVATVSKLGATMAVVAFLGVLAITAPLSPLVPKALDQAQVADPALERLASRGQLSRLQTALAVYVLDHGKSPETLDELVKAGIVDEVDVRFPWGEPYHYRKAGDATWVLLPPLR
ncbi:MAG: DUF4388 domain-containing protein [Myxococcales bacterium]